ncbi:MAG: helicase-related protein, partial [bacterium]
TSSVKPWPHQLRTFIRMHAVWPFRLLIADEVGLGKTITAGLLIRQAWLSGMARRILIMAPAGILQQWQNELYEKFNLNVPIYDGHRLIWKRTHGWQGSHEKRIGRHEWHLEPFVLCSSHLMRRRDRVQDLLEADDWDLILLDEAHHARRKAPGSPQEGGPNALLRLMRHLRSHCQALLLMTATPMQVHPIEVWDLLDLLGLPPRWAANEGDFLSYFEAARGNPSHEDMRFLSEMFRDTELVFGPLDEEEIGKIVPGLSRLGRQKVLKALLDKSDIPLKRLDAKTRQAALEVLRRFSPIRFLMARHTRELLRLYHKRGLLETPIATRDPRDVAVSLSPAERALYEQVEDYISKTYNQAAPEKRTAIGFVMTVYRRRLASSFKALSRTLTKRLDRRAEPVDEEDVSDDETLEEVMDADHASELACQAMEADEDTEIKAILKRITQLGTDSKAKELKSQLEQIFSDGYDSAIVFTHYTDTMDYLKEYLAEKFPEKSIACYSGRGGERRSAGGSWTTCSKESVRQALKRKEIRLLVCTDAAGEGLNLQYCGALINYDLPWNPMKIEQRIGRIDRIGQKYPKIRVINFAYENTVEADIYFALARRINLFQGIVGRLQPILSRLPREFQILSLQPSERRDAHRQRFIADVEQMAQESESVAFDIDEVAIEATEIPELPDPALTLEQIDASLNKSDVRPPEMDWKQLDFRSYAMQLPGMPDQVRATTSSDVFEDHFESHEFLSPGGHLFRAIEEGCVGQETESDSAEGHFWIVKPKGTSPCEFIVITRDGPRRIESLSDLLASFENLGPPGKPDSSQYRNAVIRCIA